ncbi:MAG: hypothetical protein IJ299_00870 [Oscillospiraceae bacterium]|nr:hypothetical protein [Oscillospiraceae bacterium]
MLTQSDVLRLTSGCCRALDLSYTISVAHHPFEDSFFFFQDDFLHINGACTYLKASQIEAVRYRARFDEQKGWVIFYGKKDSQHSFRLILHFNGASELDSIELQTETRFRKITDGFPDVFDALEKMADA